MTSWPAADWRKKRLRNGFSIRRGGEGAAAQDGYVEDEKIGKLEKALRPVLDLSCFTFFFLWWERLKAMKSSLSETSSTRGSDAGRHTDESIFYPSEAFVSVIFFLLLRHVYLPVPRLREHRVHHRSFKIRTQIAATELSTCLSTSWMPAVHIDARRGPWALSWTQVDIAGVMIFFFSLYLFFTLKNQSSAFESLFWLTQYVSISETLFKNRKKYIYKERHVTITLNKILFLV